MAILNVRDKDLTDETAARIRRAASAREWSIGKYLAQLIVLHDVARARADAGDDALQAELEALGLETQRA